MLSLAFTFYKLFPTSCCNWGNLLIVRLAGQLLITVMLIFIAPSCNNIPSPTSSSSGEPTWSQTFQTNRNLWVLLNFCNLPTFCVQMFVMCSVEARNVSSSQQQQHYWSVKGKVDSSMNIIIGTDHWKMLWWYSIAILHHNTNIYTRDGRTCLITAVRLLYNQLYLVENLIFKIIFWCKMVLCNIMRLDNRPKIEQEI